MRRSWRAISTALALLLATGLTVAMLAPATAQAASTALLRPAGDSPAGFW
ncbi:MAG: hypothetical protein WAK82_17165 [Streptosporangiaceae bacterium]